MYLCTVKPNRNVAQLVAHYVRDVGVGRSSRLIPTAAEAEYNKASAFLCNNSARPHVRLFIFISCFAFSRKHLTLHRDLSLMLEWWNGRHEGLKIP